MKGFEAQHRSREPFDASVVLLDDVVQIGDVILGPAVHLGERRSLFKELLKLHVLGLKNTSITDEGIAQLKWLVSLEKLYLAGTKVTAEGARQLEETLPGLTVER